MLLHANLLLIPANQRAKAHIAAPNERGDGRAEHRSGMQIAVAVEKSPSHDMGNDAPASLGSCLMRQHHSQGHRVEEPSALVQQALRC